MSFTYYDLRKRIKSQSIDLIFPGWEGDNERVVVFSPHDDDGVLGAGYILEAVMANNGEPFVFIFCQGNAGYSLPEGRDVIVDKRREEAKRAYRVLGLEEDNIIRFEYPDFSVLSYMGWFLQGGSEGTFARTIKILREIKATRLIIPNRYREHIDHEAVGRIGAFDGPQVGDEILVDWGSPQCIRSFLEYAVWGDFSPEDAMVARDALSIRANRAIKAPFWVEEKISKSLEEFESQQRIIAHLLVARKARTCGDGMLELYIDFHPRPALNYEPYKRVIGEINT